MGNAQGAKDDVWDQNTTAASVAANESESKRPKYGEIFRENQKVQSEALYDDAATSEFLQALKQVESGDAVAPIEKTDIVLPNVSDRKKLAFYLDNVFTPEECKALIDYTENAGYRPALINIGNGKQQYLPDVRNNERCIIDDGAMAQELYRRIKRYIPQKVRDVHALGCNERLRFLRYDPPQYFAKHYDGCFYRTDGPRRGERSLITVQLYLNEGFKGGNTTFLKMGTENHDEELFGVPCVPKTGRVLVFEHAILHKGSALIDGRKYTLRTDVMYGEKPVAPKSSGTENSISAAAAEVPDLT